MYIRNRRRGHTSIGRRVNTLPLRRDALDNIIGEGGDRNCIWELRMSLNAFATLCELLQVQGGLDEDGIFTRYCVRNGLKIPIGCYYLVDAGYTNGRGFLSPYRNVRYHVNEWVQGHRAPQNRLELFNKKHSSARNVIERCFGLLKKRWAILRSPSFYPIRVQSHIIIACCLLQNFIRMNMDVDPEEDATLLPEHIPVGDDTIVDEADTIDVVESSHEWTQWREDLATEMWKIWRGERGA
ncbi:uncharacterized protein LOC107461353 [Arachis duranensis]|uniref:Uncharacterized protein LOC107461353 n=1 Tax=Arachis duranensis TaxID=130453 RepID=A0A9C6WBQ8_ARADU|nr:uncharacterized protein LOC107461353 [Arachis duranensis]